MALLLLAGALVAACGQTPERKSSGKQFEIVPRSAIGPVHLGVTPAQIPGAVVEGDYGRLDQIEFRLESGAVAEIWIADIRNFPHDLVLRDQAVDPLASNAQLRSLFGVCTRHRVEAKVSRYSCQNRIALGFKPDDSGAAVELRVRR